MEDVNLVFISTFSLQFPIRFEVVNPSMPHYNLTIPRPTTTLPVIINKDLSQIQDNLSLKSTDDLKYLRSLAQDRDQ